MPTTTPFSVIVLNWNGKHFLESCLNALRAQTYRDFETILVDNGSTDGSVEYVQECFPEVSVLPLGRNCGFAAGNNMGYARARGEYIVLLNNDTEAHPLWLQEMHKATIDYPQAGSFASKMLIFDDRTRIDVCGFAVTTSGTTIDLGRHEQDGLAWNTPQKVFGACAGAAVYRRRMLEEIGFLDEDLFMTYEDLDLSFRAQLRGYGCMFVPGAIVYHRYRATMSNYPARQGYYSQRNIECVYVKNMPFGLLVASLPARMVYEIGSAMYFFKIGLGLAFLKGKIDAVGRLPKLLLQRREIQRGKTVTSRQLRAVMQRDWLGSKRKKLLSAWGISSRAQSSRSS